MQEAPRDFAQRAKMIVDIALNRMSRPGPRLATIGRPESGAHRLAAPSFQSLGNLFVAQV